MSVLLGVPSETVQNIGGVNFNAPQADNSLIEKSMMIQEAHINNAQKITSDIYKISTIAKDNADKAFAQKATNTFRSKVNELWSSVQVLKGEDYINAYKNFDKEVDRLREDIGSQYEDESIRYLYDNATSQIAQGVKEQAFAGNVRASYEFREAGLKAALAENVNQFVLDFNDSGKTKNNLNNIQNIVSDLADLQGIPKGSEGEKGLYRSAVNQAINASISYQISTKKFGLAQSNLARYKNQMDGATYISLKGMLENKMEIEAEKANALAQARAKANQDKSNPYELSKDAETVLWNKAYDEAIQRLSLENKEKKLNLSQEQITKQAYESATLYVEKTKDEFKKAGDQSTRLRVSLEYATENVLNLMGDSNLSPFEQMQIHRPDLTEKILEVYGSPREFNTAVSYKIYKVGNENKFNALTNNGRDGKKLSYYPNFSKLEHDMKLWGLNAKQQQQALELYNQEMSKKQQASMGDMEIYLRVVEGKTNVDELGVLNLGQELKNSTEANLKMDVLKDYIHDTEYQYRHDLGIPAEQSLTKQQVEDIKFLVLMKKQQINNEIETRLNEVDTTSEKIETLEEKDPNQVNSWMNTAKEQLIQELARVPTQKEIIDRAYKLYEDEKKANDGSSIFHTPTPETPFDNANYFFTSAPKLR